MRVGLFDSGIGGLTVLKTLINKYPNNEYIYFGDTKNMPYGGRSKQELIELAENNIEFLLSHNVDIIIIACGTVSSNCLTELKNKYKIPIYDIISPTINYLNNSNYQNIGIIATEATINSHVFKNNLKHNVYEIKTPRLVPLIENNDLIDIENILHTYLDEYLNKLDILVLGCTHYPIIAPYIEKISHLKLLDMSDLITIKNGKKSSIAIYFSALSPVVVNNTKRILGKDIIIKQK